MALFLITGGFSAARGRERQGFEVLYQLKRYYSLKKNKDFQFTYRAGKSVSCKLCTLIYARDRRKPSPSRSKKYLPIPNVRVGFSASKKIGNSVIRNRAKRRLREAFSPLLPNIKGGYNIIIIARPAVVDEPFEDLCKALHALVRKAEIEKNIS